MVQIGFNCQLPLSEIGLTSDSEGTGVTSLFHFHSRVLMDKFLLLRTDTRDTRFVTPKRIMVIPPLTTLVMNGFHSNRNPCPTETEFVICYSLA